MKQMINNFLDNWSPWRLRSQVSYYKSELFNKELAIKKLDGIINDHLAKLSEAHKNIILYPNLK